MMDAVGWLGVLILLLTTGYSWHPMLQPYVQYWWAAVWTGSSAMLSESIQLVFLGKSAWVPRCSESRMRQAMHDSCAGIKNSI